MRAATPAQEAQLYNYDFKDKWERSVSQAGQVQLSILLLSFIVLNRWRKCELNRSAARRTAPSGIWRWTAARRAAPDGTRRRTAGPGRCWVALPGYCVLYWAVGREQRGLRRAEPVQHGGPGRHPDLPQPGAGPGGCQVLVRRVLIH